MRYEVHTPPFLTARQLAESPTCSLPCSSAWGLTTVNRASALSSSLPWISSLQWSMMFRARHSVWVAKTCSTSDVPMPSELRWAAPWLRVLQFQGSRDPHQKQELRMLHELKCGCRHLMLHEGIWPKHPCTTSTIINEG